MINENCYFIPFLQGLQSNPNHSVVARAQLNEVSFFQLFSLEDLLSNFRSFVETLLEPYVASKVAFDGPSNAAVDEPSNAAVDGPSDAAVDGPSDAAVDGPSSESEAETEDVKLSNETISAPVASEDAISAFMSQVSELIE